MNIIIMVKLLIFTTLFLTSYTSVNVSAARILIFPFGIIKNSAQAMMEKLASFLGENGHDVHLLVYDNYKKPENIPMRNVSTVNYKIPQGIEMKTEESFALEYYLNVNQLEVWNWIFNLSGIACQSILEDKELMNSLAKSNYDVFIYDPVEICFLALANYLKIPAISLIQFGGQLKMHQQENPWPLAYLPTYKIMKNCTFFERLMNTIMYLPISAFFTHAQTYYKQIAIDHNITPNEVDSLNIHYGGFPVEIPAPLLPDMAYTDDFFISKSSGKPLPTDLAEFVDTAEHGIIIFTFGSMVSTFGDKYGSMFAEALSKLPQKVLWRYSGVPPKNLGNNVKLVKWLPQVDLLAHAKTRLLLTHGGLNSMYEAIYYGVPIVSCPINLDQYFNADRVSEYLEIGRQIDLKIATSETVYDTVTDVVQNPKYKENALRISKLFRDKPQDSGEAILFWINYVIRHKGVSHLRPYGAKLPWHQLHLVDVGTFLIGVCLIVITTMYLTCKLLIKTIKRKCFAKSSKIKKH